MDINGLGSTGAATGSSSPKASGNYGLDQDAFLQLLVAQMRNQDPLNPMDNQQFIAELAQLHTVEKLEAVSDSLELALSMASVEQSLGLLGKRVEYQTSDGEKLSGLVERVEVTGGLPILIIDGQEVSPGSVIAVLSQQA